MKLKEVNQIIRRLPKGRTLFYYFRNRYSLMLLSYLVGNGMEKEEVKSSAFGKLLSKPIVREAVANHGKRFLTSEVFESAWPGDPECYLLTLGRWGGRPTLYGYQTSRAGFNLVLQLNFCSRHNRQYRSLIKPEGEHPFEAWGHPIARQGFHTLAWSRIDIDVESGCALIEEIQNDWIRMAQWYVERKLGGENARKYLGKVLKPHIAMWDEAMLTATVWFLREEIGIRRIFYHTYESGAQLKHIYGRLPPRSLYTTLPRKFCFQETGERPAFLRNTRKKGGKRSLKEYEHTFQLLEFGD